MSPNNCRLIFGVFLAAVILSGCQHKLSGDDAYRMNQRLVTVANLSQLPMPVATLVFSTDQRSFEDQRRAAEANCRAWSITVSYGFAAEYPQWVIDQLIPHEYAHLMSCFYRGGMGESPHDEFWQQAVRRLGGNPEYI